MHIAGTMLKKMPISSPDRFQLTLHHVINHENIYAQIAKELNLKSSDHAKILLKQEASSVRKVQAFFSQ